MAIVCLGGLAILGLVFIGVLGDPTLTTRDRVLGAISAFVPIPLLVWLCYLSIRMANARRPAVTLGGDHLEIEHPALFRRPVAIPRSVVAAATVDMGTQGTLRARDRFRLQRDRDEHRDLPTWLYSKHGAPVPVIGHFRDVPNVAVLLNEPFRFRGIRRVSRPIFRHTVRSPIRTKDVRGFMFAAQHPFITEQAFRAWGVPIRTLTTTDAVALRPGPADRRRQAYRTAATVGAGLLVLGSQAFVLYRDTHRCSPLLDHGSVRSERGTQDRLSREELELLMLDVPPSYAPIGSNGVLETPEDFAQTRAGEHFDRWVRALEQHGFLYGYSRQWSGGSITISEQILQSDGVGNAMALRDRAVQDECSDAEDAYILNRHSGTVVLRYRLEGDITRYEAFFVRGPRVYVVTATERAVAPDPDVFRGYVTEAAEKAE